MARSRIPSTSPLICRDFDSTIGSLSKAAGVSPDDLADAVRAFDGSILAERLDENPYRLMPESVLAGLGTDIESLRFDCAHYFHGTRAPDPSIFNREGILPLDQIVAQIWDTMYGLVSDRASPDQWAAFREDVEHGGGGNSGCLYRMKTRDPLHYGPNSCLIRDALLHVPDAAHDYLACPEIVQDIARCWRGRNGINLEARFSSATVPCIVEYEGPVSSVENAVSTACWYLRYKLRDEEFFGPHIGWGADRHGVAVPPDAVVAVTANLDRLNDTERPLT